MITLNQHKQTIFSRIIASFSDDSAPAMGFGAWFPSLTTSDKLVGIEVERNRQFIAADVQRNTGGNVNSFSTYSQKLFMPPYYEEKFDFSAVEYYNVTFGAENNPNQSQAFSMIREATRRTLALKHKIQRAIERMRSQVLQTGIVTLVSGDNIDYKRKAGSLVALTGTNVWSNAAGKPKDNIEAGIKFIRQEGKSGTRSFDLIMGSTAFTSFMNNAQIKGLADFRRISVLDIGTTKFDNRSGLNYHGRLSTSNGNVDLWTYDDFYETSAGVFTEYIDPKNTILLPRDFVGTTSYAGVPAIKRDRDNAEYPEYIQQMEAEFYMNNYIDPKVKAHWFEVNSAPLPVPVSIDRIYTLKVEE